MVADGGESEGRGEQLVETNSLRSLRVVACWVEMASRKFLAVVTSAREVERRGANLAETASEMVLTFESKMSSSRMKAAAWMARLAAVGTLGIAAAASRIRTILVRSKVSSGAIQSLPDSHLRASLALRMGPRFGLAYKSVMDGRLGWVAGVPDAPGVAREWDLLGMC